MALWVDLARRTAVLQREDMPFLVHDVVLLSMSRLLVAMDVVDAGHDVGLDWEAVEGRGSRLLRGGDLLGREDVFDASRILPRITSRTGLEQQSHQTQSR